ncbi:hypothetical protein [Luteimonas sp. A482]
MRQVFSSARIENVQAVAKLLADEGIEVRVEDGQRYRRSIRSGFSYRESGGNASRASVWVVRSDDQSRARQLLHAAGLLEATPANPASFLPGSGHAARAAAPKRRAQVGLGMFLVAAVALALWLNQFRTPGWDLPTPVSRTVPANAPLDPSLQAINTVDAVHLVPTPPALAVTLAVAEQARVPGAQLCLSVDGQDPGEATQAAAREAGLDPAPASACPGAGDVLRVDVSDYRTDGSGAGTIALDVARGDAAPAVRQLDVRREGDAWQVGDTL